MIQAKNRAESLKMEEMKDSGYGTNTNVSLFIYIFVYLFVLRSKSNRMIFVQILSGFNFCQNKRKLIPYGFNL